MNENGSWSGDADFGVALGRFQPLHLKHLEYLLAAKRRCEVLVVGITNPDSFYRAESLNDPHRSLPENNPFSFFERQGMVSDALLEAGLRFRQFQVVPAPLGTPQLLEYLPAPEEATVYVTVYDDWGNERVLLLEELGYAVRTLWRRRPEEKGITATDVRRQILSRGEWRSLVPYSVVPWVMAALQQGRFARSRSSNLG